MHYSDVFGNIFEQDTLHKKQFPDGLDGVTTSKGGTAHAIMCCFCPYVCSNNDYAYHHLAATHLNLQWGCGVCSDFRNGYVSNICEHIQTHMKTSSKERSQSSHRRDEYDILGSPLDDRVSSDEKPSQGDSPAGEEDCEWSEVCVSEEVSEDGLDWDSD